MVRYWLLAASVLYYTQATVDDVCYSTDEDTSQRKQFSTLTSYDAVRGTDEDAQPVTPGCKPVRLWMVCRHGARLPPTIDIDHISENLPELRDLIWANYANNRTSVDSKLCDEDLKRLGSWRWIDRVAPYGDELVPQGWHEMRQLGARMRRRFTALFVGPYKQQHYVFRHTSLLRTNHSFHAFTQGFFAARSPQVPSQPVLEHDLVLVPITDCEPFFANVDRQNEDDTELGAFKRSDLFVSSLMDISRRLGFQATNLTYEQVSMMWTVCRYEQAWEPGRRSPWCGVFTRDKVDAFEYKEDVYNYYMDGYGYDSSAEPACYTIRALLRELASSEPVLLYGYFTHDVTIQLLLVAFGYHRDAVPLRGGNYEDMKHRQYRSSELPFGANIVAVKYECDDAADPIKVKFFLNEKPMVLDWCDANLCSWRALNERFAELMARNCDSTYCQRN